jgi:hypothetical protein
VTRLKSLNLIPKPLQLPFASSLYGNWFKSDSSDNLLSEGMEYSERFGNTKLTDIKKLIKRVNDKINNSEKDFLFIFDNCEADYICLFLLFYV